MTLLVNPNTNLIIEVTRHQDVVYDAAFGGGISELKRVRASQGFGGHLEVADVGAGLSAFYTHGANHDINVTRIDPIYADMPPEGDGYIAASASDMPEVPDGSYDATLASFLLQHLDRPETMDAIKEMIRITRPLEDGGGPIMIYPIYKPKLYRTLVELFPDTLGYATTDGGMLSERGLPTHTALILNSQKLTPDVIDRLARGLANSDVFWRRETIADKIRRFKLQRSGSSVVDLTLKH